MKRLGMLLVLSALVGMSLSVSGATSDSGVAQVEIKDVEVRVSDHGPVVLLKAENKVIAIFVDPTVAGSIQGVLTGRKTKRPLSHDLMHSILEEFGGKVTQAVITLKDSIYYGALTVVLKDKSKVFDSRSSDAIALAIHSKAPIIVGRDLLDSAGKRFPDSSGSVTL